MTGQSSRVQAVIFDMDGTLLDSEPLYMKVFQESARTFGFTLTEALYLSTVGSTMTASYQALVDAFGPDFPLAAFQKAWPERWEHYVRSDGVPLKPGVPELFGRLEQGTIKRGVATSSYRSEALLCLEATGLLARVQTVVTGDEVTRGKPDPEIYLEAARRLEIQPENCLAFEDSSLGALAALGAGMRVIVIPDLVAPLPDVVCQAYAVVSSMTEALGLVENLL